MDINVCSYDGETKFCRSPETAACRSKERRWIGAVGKGRKHPAIPYRATKCRAGGHRNTCANARLNLSASRLAEMEVRRRCGPTGNEPGP